jgi:hypothetical protein
VGNPEIKKARVAIAANFLEPIRRSYDLTLNLTFAFVVSDTKNTDIEFRVVVLFLGKTTLCLTRNAQIS